MSIRYFRSVLAKRRKLAVSFAFLLAFAFNANLAHSHDSELHEYVDCEVCLKLDQDDEFASTEKPKPDFAPVGKSFADTPLTPNVVDILDVRSRSPPRS